MNMTDEQRLREALAHCVGALEDAGHPGTHRNCSACDAFNEGHEALAQQAPTLAVSEPAAPVDARDGLGALANINDLACFASEEDTSIQAAVLLQIGQIARAALTRQATGEKT